MTQYLDPAQLAVEHAVIVAGHSVLVREADPTLADNWILLPFQRNEVHCYIEHVQAGVQIASADPRSMLIFAGGQSRREAGPRSEAQAYFWIAEHYGWFGESGIAARATTEEFSRGSFENLLFGICRFREITGSYPGKVTFVSWRFKQERFSLHRDAIRWPADRLMYAGVNDPPDFQQALEAEARTRAAYARDPYSSGPEFTAKRAARNPFRRQHGYAESCPEVAALFRHRGPELYSGSLPWS